MVETRVSRGVLDVHPGLMIPAIVVLSEFGAIWLLAAAPVVAILRDLVRYAAGRLGDPPKPANVLPGERVRRRGLSRASAAVPAPAIYRDRIAWGPAGSPGATAPGPRRSQATAAAATTTNRTFAFSPATPKAAAPAIEPGAPSRERRPGPDHAAGPGGRTTPLDEPEPPASPYVQLTEVAASPLEAADAIERRDAYGRVPVVVRIRRQPPIRIEAVLIAVALGASGLLLPLFLALQAVIIVGAVVALFIGFIARLFIRIPPGSVGLIMKGGRHSAVLPEGIHRVNPFLVLTHIVTTREIAFDVPVNEARSADGVAISIDLMLTVSIADPGKFAYAIATSDADQLIHAAAQDVVRRLARSVEAMDALDLGDREVALVREAIDARLDGYGIDVRDVSFTRVTLPAPFTASLEARRLAVVQLAEQADSYQLERRRLANQVSLVAQQADARSAEVTLEAVAEDLRLAKLEERLAANPNAARYDLELARIRVAEQLAGNSRAVVSLGGSDLLAGLLTAREAADVPAAGPAATAPAKAGSG